MTGQMPLALVARPLAEALIGEDLREGAISIIPWIAFSGLLNGVLIYYVSESFQLAQKTLQRAALMIIPAVLNIGLNVILIPQLGLQGAVIATVASYATGVIVLALAGRRYLALPFPPLEFARIGLSSLAMWPVIAILPDWGSWPELVAKATAGALTYLVAAYVLNAGSARTLVRETLSRSTRPQDAQDLT